MSNQDTEYTVLKTIRVRRNLLDRIPPEAQFTAFIHAALEEKLDRLPTETDSS